VLRYTTPSGQTPMPPCLVNKKIIAKPATAANIVSTFFLKAENRNMKNYIHL
jgi:hypothetical protein